MNIRILNNINDDNINKLIEWNNRKGPSFLEQWAGKDFKFPLKSSEIFNIKSSIFSIFEEDKFVGIIQKIRSEDTNVHIGRFIINPDCISKGIGKKSLQKFCDLLFNDEEILSISLNVFDYNEHAINLYIKLGFEIMEITNNDGNKTYRMILKR